MEDYKQEIKDLILRYYEPSGSSDALYKSTLQILQMCQGVIPNQPITQHDVYEIMKELGFTIQQIAITEKVMIYEGDEEQGIPPKYDNVEKDRVFLWELYENKSSHTIKMKS